jgi:hypothetical protein
MIEMYIKEIIGDGVEYILLAQNVNLLELTSLIMSSENVSTVTELILLLQEDLLWKKW